MNSQYLYIPWSQYHQLTLKLAATILSHDKKYDEIVAVSRGGLTLGHLLSDFMNMPISTFSIQSYTDIQVSGETKILSGLTKSIVGANILLVDDVSDTGKTFLKALEYLKDFKPASISTVGLYLKPHSVYRPDFFAKQTSKWIIFPYETTETIKLITHTMETQNKTKAQIQQFLERLGFLVDQIAFVRKYHLSK